jgi:hypothetical protein
MNYRTAGEQKSVFGLQFGDVFFCLSSGLFDAETIWRA